MSDPRVADAQTWANNTYTGRPGYVPIVVDGQTGWQTMFSLTRALQIELGITSISDNFGPTTLAQLTAQVGDITATTIQTKPEIFKILQAALWCKGYWGGTFGVYDANVGSGITRMKTDMGLSSTISLPPKAFKSALTMDAYVRVGNGTEEIRAVQQWLNARYLNRRDFFLIPCDGSFSRNVQNGLMLAIQYEIGMADGVATGNFGPGTQQGIRDYGLVSLGSVDGTKKMVSLYQAALIFNGYAPGFDGIFGSNSQSQTQTFQQFAQLSVTGGASYETWASLLVSTGDPNRATSGADTSTRLTTATANQLYSSGYRSIGRYLTVDGKSYAPGELELIVAAGLKTFPIFQNANNAASYFTDAIGFDQGKQAVRRARQLGFKSNTILYFCVDYDPTGGEIAALIIPFFQAVKRAVDASIGVPYRIGAYGTRNVCVQLAAASLTVSSFVSGMSTGWSGNLGFPLPSNWFYDQIQNITIGAGASLIEIDKDVISSAAHAVGSTDVLPTPLGPAGSPPAFDPYFWWWTELAYDAELARAAAGSSNLVGVVNLNDIVLRYVQVRNGNYDDALWGAFAPPSESYAPAGPYQDQVALVRAGYAPPNGAIPNTAYLGQVDHFAASTRGYTTYWDLPPVNQMPLGDLSGWALDLATCWRAYEIERVNGTYVGNIAQWCSSFIGTTSERGTFPTTDLVADIDGFLVAKRLYDDNSRPVSDVIRELLVSNNANPQWRYQRFYAERFNNTRSNIVDTVVQLFDDPGVFGVLVIGFVGDRWPGDSTNHSSTDPPAAVIATEISDIANAFADKIIGLTV